MGIQDLESQNYTGDFCAFGTKNKNAERTDSTVDFSAALWYFESKVR